MCRPSLHIHSIPTSLPGGTGKRLLGVGGLLWNGVGVPRTLDYTTVKLNPR